MLIEEVLMIARKRNTMKIIIHRKTVKEMVTQLCDRILYSQFGFKKKREKRIVVCVTNAGKQDKRIYTTTGNVII